MGSLTQVQIINSIKIDYIQRATRICAWGEKIYTSKTIDSPKFYR